MLNLQDKLIELSSYNVGCQINSGYALVNITYPTEWSVVPPSNELIEYDTQKGIYYYCAPMDKVPLEEVFDSINETIEYNIELKKKLDLFQEKVEILRQLFIDEDFETLSTIDFKIKKKRVKKDKLSENVKFEEENIENSVTVEKENIQEKVKEEAFEEESMVTEEVVDDEFVPDPNDPIAQIYSEGTKTSRRKRKGDTK